MSTILFPRKIYFIARRHKIRLYQALLAPFFVLFIPFLLFLWAIVTTNATTPYVVGTILLVADLLWALRRQVDWSNDY